MVVEVYYNNGVRSVKKRVLGKEGRSVKLTEMEAALDCIQCREETLHRIVYLNGKIQKVECTECHHYSGKEKINLKKELFNEIYERISTKPSRMTQEYKEDLNTFISGLPPRVINKPFGLIKYLNETKDAFKKSKDS